MDTSSNTEFNLSFGRGVTPRWYSRKAACSRELRTASLFCGKSFTRISAWIQKWLRITNTSVLSPLTFNRNCFFLSSLLVTYSTCVNFGFTSSAIQSCGDNDVVMYCWPEIVGKRGSDEVISCLHDYLSKLPPGVMTFRLYSDGCGERNKNINVL